SEAHEIDISDIIEVDKLSPQQRHNAELLLDIYVSVTVELGRTNYKVKDVLGLGEGSIVELAKPASEPVDLLVNNRLIARGEVVVIDENFGARVTNIVKPLEKIIPE
ncbi:MAG TPA: flagellar motor switch protein FliN, partial [Spirochaetes bacterium]|nr:flagellar motor switch protein FliN [Spirochaetota bacterium]